MSGSKGGTANNGLDLSLSGSQIMSARSAKSINKKPVSARGLNSNTNHIEQTNGYTHEPRKKPGSSGRSTTPLNPHVTSHTAQPSFRPKSVNVSDDFLALFESHGTRPKDKNRSPKKPSSNIKMSKSSAFPGSAESTPRSYQSKRTNSVLSQNTGHSMFLPDSPRSVSTFTDGESTSRTFQSSRQYSPQSTARSTTSSVAERIQGNVSGSWRENYTSALINNELEAADTPVHSLDASPLVYNSVGDPDMLSSGTRSAATRARASTSNHKDLNATNNMLPQNFDSRRPPKLHLRTMQNSYQNPTYNVNKTPVNEVLPSFKTPISKNQAEDYIKQVNMAACVIQNAFRKYVRRRKALRASEAAMKRLLAQKREDLTQKQEQAATAQDSEAVRRQRVREEKAKQARLLAIEELNRRRAEEKEQSRKVAEAEIEQLKAAGKVGTKKLVTKSVAERTKRPLSACKRVSPREQTSLKKTGDRKGSEAKLVAEDVTASSKTAEMAASPRGAESDIVSMSQSQTGTTFDDLMSTLKLLEEEEQLPPPPENRVHAWAMEQENEEQPQKELTTESLHRHTQESHDSKMKNILSFLDEVETSDRLEEIDQNQQRELTIRHAKETEKEMSKRLDVQKNEYEETVQRHLSFIDQLIDDKKSLSEKCEKLVTEMKQVDKKSSEKLRQMQETHDRELAKLKEMITAQEKVKREKWIEEKTKKIKDLTVKGLEPEIQRLIGKHKSELKKLKTIHEAELLQSDERAGQRYVNMTEELRDQLAKEKEAACQRERELAAQRYEKQLQAEEEAYQQSRRRLYQEVQDEKERLANQAVRQRQEMDKMQRQLEDSHSSSSEAMRKEFEKAREEQERRHQAELTELKERLTIERDAWEQNYMKKQEAWLLSKERELKESVKQERDREIELVINRLEDDGVQSREECERAAENRIKRIREKYETELEELERSERSAMEKYNQMKAELLEAQGERERLKVLNKQKEQEVDDVKRLSEKLHRERDHVQDVVRQEFADKLIATDEENKRVKQEMAELKSRHKVEIERMKQEVELMNKAKQEEMDAVHNRVKQAIAKKEEVVSQVKQQYQAALKRADHLEGLLEQQRKQLLGGNKK
ncbi:centrosomal protein of 131 kDa-like isoform X2 [Watersipora subatra]|uniref:centrosomal protein of 131 kDa-like isoform X2 n=1 Tax=Watersipora subatra TaxID=2589382 RepID=UPI00355C2DCF